MKYHNRIFVFCSAKVTWFMQNASEAIEYVRSMNDHGETYNLVMRSFIEHGYHGYHGYFIWRRGFSFDSLMRRGFEHG